MKKAHSILIGTALGGLLATMGAPSVAAPDPGPAVTAPDPARQALTELAARPDSPLPAGTRVRSVNIQDGLATVDFSRELKDNFHGGDTQEAAAVNSILKTMGRFPTVDRVQILVAGRRIDSLGGLITLDDPLPVVRPSGATTARRLYLHRRTH